VSDEYSSKRFNVEILVDPRTGRIVGERWHDQRGQLDRAGDLPAYVDYCPETGAQIYARWHKEGALHRNGDQPATLVTLPNSGIIICEQYAILGHDHRDGDQPSFIMRDDEGRLEERSFYRHGDLHREAGPAVERFNPKTGERLAQEFWLNGQKQDPNTHPSPSFG